MRKTELNADDARNEESNANDVDGDDDDDDGDDNNDDDDDDDVISWCRWNFFKNLIFRFFLFHNLCSLLNSVAIWQGARLYATASSCFIVWLVSYLQLLTLGALHDRLYSGLVHIQS